MNSLKVPDILIDDLLAAQSQILKLPSPATRVQKVLRGWFDSETPLWGFGKLAYLEEHDKKDIVALRPAKGEDRLSQFLRDHCSSLLKVCTAPHPTPLILDY